MTRFTLRWKKTGEYAANANDLIDRYLDGRLSEQEQEEFEERCFRDDALFMEVREREDFRQKVAQVIQEEGEEIFSALPAHANVFSKLAERIKDFFATEWEFAPRWGYALVTASAIALAGLVIYKGLDRKTGVGPVDQPVAEKKAPEKPEDSRQEGVPEKEDSLKLEIDVKQFYAANFAPIPHLEAWIKESTRSESTAVERVDSPRVGEEIAGSEIIFQWKMAENLPVSFRILNNREEELLTRSPDSAQFPMITIRVKTEIFKEPGLYYWKIEGRDDVLFVGKFLFLGN